MDFKHSDRYRKVGLLIALYRKERGFTQQSLAEKSDISVSTIGKVETAAAGMTLDMLFNIADALEIDPYKLLDFPD